MLLKRLRFVACAVVVSAALGLVCLGYPTDDAPAAAQAAPAAQPPKEQEASRKENELLKVNPDKGDVTAVVKGNNEFAFDLYGQLRKQAGNLFFSPYSISTALAMTYAGARGQTAEQMAQTLHFTLGQQRLPPAFHDLLRLSGAGKDSKYQLVVANRLWGQKDYGFLPDFIKLTQASHGAGLQEVDFIHATEQARKAINAWVEQQTHDKIKELLKPGILTVDSRLVLSNAIYFKAAWLRPFRPKATAEGPFHVSADRQVKVPLMHGSQRTSYFKDEGFEALELPYKSHDLSMLIFLPKAGGLVEFEKSLTEANLVAWQRKLSDHQVKVTLTKFKVTAEYLLKPALEEMGMPLAFDRRRADFSGMTTRERLFISHVVHKAFVDVHEAGTEAAASTAVEMEKVSKPQSATFVADRPFVYLIRDNRTGSILFLGRVVNPTPQAEM